MVNPNPPLFVQDGEYPARLDRNLIGGVMLPGGDASFPLLPRGGVRAHFVNMYDEEVALLPQRDGTRIRIQPGVAFVPGPISDGIASIYQITSPNVAYITPPAVISGADQKGIVGITVTDPGDAPAVGAAEGKWEFIYLSTIPATDPVPPIFLRLANITVPGNASNPIVVSDVRQYTTALGGTYATASFDTLRSADPGYPYGSQAYSLAQDITYVRAKDGWAQHPALAKLNATASNGGITGRPGELLYNTANSTLAVYNGGWVDIARVASAARLASATSWPVGPNEAHITQSSLKIQIADPNQGKWMSISHGGVLPWKPEAGEQKQSENSLMLQVYNYSPGAMVTIYFYATVYCNIKDANGTIVPDATNTFFLNAESFTSVATGEMVFDENGKPDGFVQQYSLVDADGEKWDKTTTPIKQDSYIPMSKLGMGIINIRPVFKAAKPGFFEIRDFKIKVNTM